MQAYDAVRFNPPAPLALVVLKSDRLGLEIHGVPMLLDTGADVSLVPHAQAATLLSSEAKEYELEAFGGARSTAPAVAAELQFLGKPFEGSFW